MTFLRKHHFLIFIGALLYVAGHVHQVLGKYEAHHHGIEMQTGEERNGHHSGTHNESDEEKQKDADHMLAAHGVMAVMPALMVPPIVAMHGVALVGVRAVEMPEAPVVGIDHPPQLRG